MADTGASQEPRRTSDGAAAASGKKRGSSLMSWLGKKEAGDSNGKLTIDSAPATAGCTATLRLAAAPELVTTIHDCTTLYESLLYAVKQHGGRKCLGVREKSAYKFRTYQEVFQQVERVGSGFGRVCGMQPGDFMGILLKTCPEWTVTNQSNHCFNRCTVTIYETLGPGVVEYIVNETKLKVLVIAADRLAQLCDVLGKCKTLEHIVVVGEKPVGAEVACKLSAKVHSFADIESAGAQEPMPVSPPAPKDLALICYTSGTTGRPKGVMHSHATLVACLAGAFTERVNITNKDVHLAFLPLAHVMEYFLQEAFLHCGVAMGFFGGDISRLMDDVKVLRPTVFVAVPRLLNRVADAIKESFAKESSFKRKLIDNALVAKTATLKDKGHTTNVLFDSLVFRKVRDVLGGRVRLLVTGSAPIEPSVLEFLRVTLSADVQEGFGMVEVLITNITKNGDHGAAGSIGPPLPSCEIRLEDIPDLKYSSKDEGGPRGELLIRGPTVTLGYFGQPEKTKEFIDKDGWAHTGDVATILPNGAVKIIDRKKAIFKLSQGEYIIPEKLEAVYKQCSMVADCFVYGESLRSFVVAVVVPKIEPLLAFTKEKGIDSIDIKELCANEVVRDHVLSQMVSMGKKFKLNGFEIVCGVHLCPTTFDKLRLHTPTSKFIRHEAKNIFVKELQALYEEATERRRAKSGTGSLSGSSKPSKAL